MSEHTKGPWAASVTYKGSSSELSIWADGMKIAHVAGLARFDYANAQLIAAAPDLLEALKGLLMVSLPRDISGQRHIDNAHAAIARAEGQEQFVS